MGVQDEDCEDRPELCDACGMVIASDSALYAFVPDSSSIHAVDPTMDGQRLVATCSDEHLAQLQAEYATRPFIDEQLWIGKITRALARSATGQLQPGALVDATGLSLEQIEKAVAWHNTRLKKHRRGGPS